MVTFLTGTKVTYVPFHGASKELYQKGMVKVQRKGSDHVFVVFNCDDNWSHYMDYTAQNTPISKLLLGWED